MTKLLLPYSIGRTRPRSLFFLLVTAGLVCAQAVPAAEDLSPLNSFIPLDRPADVIWFPADTIMPDTLAKKKAAEGDSVRRLLEEKLAQKSREELYREIFNTAPPELPKQLDATLVINGAFQGSVDLVFTDDRQDFSMPAASLAEILATMVTSALVKELKSATDTGGRISQQALQKLGLQVAFDSKEYQLRVVVPAALLSKQIHRLSGGGFENPDEMETVRPNMLSAFLNVTANQKFRYSQNSMGGSDALSQANRNIRQPFSGTLEGALNFMDIVLEGAATMREVPRPALQRNDVRLVFDSPRSALRMSAGDIKFPTQGFLSFVPMGGWGIAKEYSLQPYTFTYPVSEYEFHISEPAEVEVLIDGAAVRKMVLQAGTHDIRGFPFSLGTNDVKIILKDISGRTEIREFSFLHQPLLLAKGRTRFSLHGGFPSRLMDGEYVYDSDRPSFVFTYNRGLTNTLTAGFYSQAFSRNVTFSQIFSESGAENTPEFSRPAYQQASLHYALTGMGALYALPRGTVELNAAGGYGRTLGADFAARLAYTYESKLSRKSAREKHKSSLSLNTPLTWRMQAEYRGPQFPQTAQDSFIYYKEIGKFSTDLSIPLVEQLTVNIGLRDYILRDTTNQFEFLLRMQKTWLKRLRANLSFQYASAPRGGYANPAVAANLQWSFRSGHNDFGLRQEVRRHPPAVAQSADAAPASTPLWDFNTGLNWYYDNSVPRPEKLSASAAAQMGSEYNSYYGRAGYNGNQGGVEILQSLDELQSPMAGTHLQHQTSLAVRTALVFAGGAFSLARPVHEGFAIVRGVKNLKGTKIAVNPTDQGYEAITNRFGPAVLPLYAPYQVKRLKLEPVNPPLGVVTGRSDLPLYPQYKSGFCIELGLDRSVLVFGELLDISGKPFAYQGLTISRTGSGSDPIKTFTNETGRFQFLAHEGATYKISSSAYPDLHPVSVVIPKKNENGFWRAGNLRFKEKEPLP